MLSAPPAPSAKVCMGLSGLSSVHSVPTPRVARSAPRLHAGRSRGPGISMRRTSGSGAEVATVAQSGPGGQSLGPESILCRRSHHGSERQQFRRSGPRRPVRQCLRSPISRRLRNLVFAFPVRPSCASVAYKIALKNLFAAYTCVLAGTTYETFRAWTCGHNARAFPINKYLVTIRIHDHARSGCIDSSLIDVVVERAINSGLVHEALALVIEHYPR